MLISYERAEEIAKLYYDDVYHLCLARLKREEEAADITQEVFLFFQEQFSELDDIKIKAWLYSVANNKIKEKFRDIAKREKELIFGTQFGSSESADLVYEIELDNVISDKEIDEKKSSILKTLSDKELKLFEMVYTKHMEYEELAKALNITNSAARTRVSRLNAKIKERVTYAFMALLLLFMRF